MGLKRVDLRRLISQRVDDFWTAKAAVPAVGAAGYTTINSTYLTERDAEYWREADAVIAYAGAGGYDHRRVTDYVPTVSGLTGGIVTVDATLSLIPSTNTDIHLYRKFRRQHYDDAISAALRRAGEEGLVECLHTDSSIVATARIWEYAIPTGSNISRILDVYWLDANNYDQPIHLSRYQWGEKRQAGVTTLQMRSDTLVAASMSFRVEGMGPPVDLTADGQELEDEVPTEYVVDYGVGELRLSRWSGTDPEDSARQATFMKQMAEGKLRSAQRFSNRGRLRRHW